MTHQPVHQAAEEWVKVLVTGATGLIGSAVIARLLAEGYEITGIARHTARAARSLPQVKWIALDIAHATSPESWMPHLDRFDAVVSCAGALQDAPGTSLQAVHVDGIRTLFEACERAGLRSPRLP